MSPTHSSEIALDTIRIELVIEMPYPVLVKQSVGVIAPIMKRCIMDLRSIEIGTSCRRNLGLHMGGVLMRRHHRFIFRFRSGAGKQSCRKKQYDEISCVNGAYGLLILNEFMHELMAI